MREKVAVIGGGSWGTALAQLAAYNKHQVLLWLRDKKLQESINRQRINKKYFPDLKLKDNIRACTDLEKVLQFAQIIVLAVPTHVTRRIMEEMQAYLKQGQIIVSTAKGIEEGSFLRNSEIIKSYTHLPVAVLSGPSHAEEVMAQLPTAVVVAARQKEIARRIQALFMTPFFRVYTNPDLTGVEMGGAVKNVIALAAGIIDGLGYGDNTIAALITRGLHEIAKAGIEKGGSQATFAGLAGLGDLVVTCTSKHSRNRRFGVLIGHGFNTEEALKQIGQVVEGYRTTKALYQSLCQENAPLELPITGQVYQVLYQGKDPHQAVDELMLRSPKPENKKIVEELNW